jgi:hypothetical protein
MNEPTTVRVVKLSMSDELRGNEGTGLKKLSSPRVKAVV